MQIETTALRRSRIRLKSKRKVPDDPVDGASALRPSFVRVIELHLLTSGIRNDVRKDSKGFG